MRILVTGANGFIGRHLVQHLVAGQQVVSVVGVDCSGNPPTEDSRYRALVADLSKDDWRSDLEGERFDLVLHLAQSARYRDFPEGAEDMARVNIMATTALLDFARGSGVRRVIFTSSGNVYAPARTLLEETSDCVPRSFYAATKLSAEYLVRQYGGMFDAVILRLFSVYGPGQARALIPDIIHRVREGREVTLASGVGLYLTPTYVADCVSALARMMECALPSPAVTYNVAGDEVVTLGDIAARVGEIVGRPPVTREMDGEPNSLQGDGTKLWELIGLRARIGISEGLKRTVDALGAPETAA